MMAQRTANSTSLASKDLCRLCQCSRRLSALRSKDAGSFIRPTANIIYGVTFLAALTSKYIEDLHGSEAQEKVTLGSSQGAIQVEAVSLDKIRQKFARLDRLREVSLDNLDVAKADPPGTISKTCPSKQCAKGADFSLIQKRCLWLGPFSKSLAKLGNRGCDYSGITLASKAFAQVSY
jgi:hypothetical protein